MALFVAGKDKWLEDNPHADLTAWRAHVHTEFEWDLQHTCWMPLVCQIHQLVLRQLEVNVQNCYCPCGCVGQLSWAMGWLCDWEGQPPDELVVVGTRSHEERAEITNIVENPARAWYPKLSFEKTLDAVTLAITNG